jgi:TRAP-type C4-dicarboxylate transport system substrate-binding protein
LKEKRFFTGCRQEETGFNLTKIQYKCIKILLGEGRRAKLFKKSERRRLKMRYRKWMSLFLCVSVVGFAFTVSPAHGQIKLTYSNFFPAPHTNCILSVEWGKEIEKRTNGRVQITVFPGGTLTPADKCYDGVVKGISDIGMSVLSYTMGRFPLSEVLDLPLGSRTAMTATRLTNDFYKKFKPKEFDDVKVMYLHAHGPGIVHTRSKPIYKLEDLKGVKIRATGTTAKVAASLGATPVAMPMPETYDAISRGVADGVVCPVEALKGWKLGEVVKFTTQDFGSAYNLSFFVVMNKDKWNSLPPDIQKIIEQVNEEWIVKTGKNWDEIDKVGYEFIRNLGNKVIPLSKEEDARWAKAVEPLFADYVKEKTAKGLPAAEALKFCRERLKQLQ